MVGALKSPQSTPSAKRQQSISAFFSKKDNISKPIKRTDSQASDSALHFPEPQLSHDGPLFIASDEEESIATTNHRKSTNPKRVFGEVNSTINGIATDEDLPTSKRLRRLPSTSDGNAQHAGAPKLTASAGNQITRPRLTDRTSKYIYSSSPVEDEENERDDDEITRRKESLHQRFVKKLGRPDSIAEINRRDC